MEKKQVKKEIPDFSHVERHHVPGEHTWKADDIYVSIEQWKEDKKKLSIEIEKVEELKKEWTTSAPKLLEMLQRIDEVEKKINRLAVYASLLADTDMGESSYQSMEGEIMVINVNFQGKLSFLRPGIISIGKEKIKEYLESEPGLRVYEIVFDKIWRQEKHILDEEKEEITALTGLFSGTPEKASEMLNNVEIPYPRMVLSDGTKFQLNQANYVRYRESENRVDRRKVMHTYWKYHTRFKNTHAALLDGEIKNHYFHAKVHHYSSCLEAALYPKNIDLHVYHNLIETVKDNLEPLHRYMALKERLLKLEGDDGISYDDIYATAVPGSGKLFTIDEAEELVCDALAPLGPGYGKILKQGFASRWMDIYPNKGKRSGAYSNGAVYDSHPYVLMNYNGNFNTVTTLAHEFGHALHSYLSNQAQPYPIARYPIFLAEIASTFNEALLVRYMLKNETDKRFKMYLLDRYIEELRGTLYRQTLFADFELAMHEEVEKGGTLTPEWLDQKYLELTRLFYGHQQGVMKVDKYIQNEWSAVPHFYYYFYVYQYSTGIVASSALAEMVLSGGNTERDRYLEFLKAGGSAYPLHTLSKAGVDLTKTEPLLVALKGISDLVTEMEKLADETK